MTTRFTGWRKSSYSGTQGQCVEVGLAWRKSSYSGSTGQCVEVAAGSAVVGVRDSKNSTGPVLAFPAGGWARFLADLR